MSVGGETIDARPINVVSDRSRWSAATHQRRRIAGIVRATLAEKNFDALVVESSDGIYPPWVRLEAWVHSDGKERAARRSELEFVVNVHFYHEHDITITATLQRDNRKISITDRFDLSDRDIQEWVLRALYLGPKPKSYTPVADVIGGFFLALIPFMHGPYHNPISERFKNAFSLNDARMLTYVSLVIIYVTFTAGSDSDYSAGSWAALALGVAGLIGAFIIMRRRRKAVSVPSEPPILPLHLVLLDSWHTVVAGLADRFDRVRQQLSSRLFAIEEFGIRCRLEPYTFRTPNGIEERERIVATKGQGAVHVHVYQFGDDIYFGWQAYLNWAKWQETTKLTQRVANGNITEYKGLQSGLYVPNLFDLIDLNSLSELIHKKIQEEIQDLMRESRIDQEIDFTIVRGDRNRALDREQHKATTEQFEGRWSRLTSVVARWRSESELQRSSVLEDPTATGSSRTTFTGSVFLLPLLAALAYLGSTYLPNLDSPDDLGIFGFFPFTSEPYLVSAALIGFALWRYTDAGLARATIAAVAILVVSAICVNAIGSFAAMRFYYTAGRTLGSDPVTVAYFTTCMAAALSLLIPATLFERRFRTVRMWSVFVVAWLVGGALALWMPAIAEANSGNLLFYAARVAGFGVAGYLLQRTSRD